MCPPPEVVRTTDELEPIVRSADDHLQIVRRPDDLRRGIHAHTPSAKIDIRHALDQGGGTVLKTHTKNTT